jgi:hypothetical protein
MVLVVLLMLGCKVEPAPEDVDALIRYLFDLSDDGDDAQLAEAVRNLDSAIGGSGFQEAVRGEVSPLGSDAATRAGVSGDPNDAGGLYLLNPLACTLDALLPVLTNSEQDVLYDGVYDQYERTYTSDLDAFIDGGSPTLSWDVAYSASALSTSYDALLDERLRLVPGLGEDDSPFGAFFLSRRLMTAPAVMTNGDGYFDQDYKVELYYERAPGEMVHLHGMWRELEVLGLTMEDGGMQTLLLNGMEDWDEETLAWCAAGVP